MYEESEKPVDTVKIQLTQFLSDGEPIMFSPEQVEEARRRFGNVSIDKVYLGVKLDSDAQLDTYRALQDKPATVDVSVSQICFKYRDDALDSIMSWDDLATAIKNGSTGRYGCALVELAPEPEQVVYKSWNDRGDGVKNPERKLIASSSKEVLLSGTIKTIKCIVFEKLDTTNWKQEIKKLVTQPEEIANRFLRVWCNDKLDAKEYYPFAKALIKSICTDESKTINCIIELNSNESIIPFEQAASIPPIENTLMKYLVFDKDSIRFEKDNNRMGVSHDLIKKTFAKNYGFAIRGMKDIIQDIGKIKIRADLAESTLYINNNTDAATLNNLFFLAQVLDIVPDQVRKRFFTSMFGKNMIKQSRDIIESLAEADVEKTYKLSDIIGANGELLEYTNDKNRYFKILANRFRSNRILSSELSKIRG